MMIKRLLLVLSLFFLCLNSVGAVSYFEDNFNRADNTTIGNGWTESAGGGAAIKNNKLEIDMNVPIANLELSNSTLGNITPRYFGFEFNSTDILGGDGCDIRLIEGSTIGLRLGGWCYAGVIRYNSGGWIPIMNVTANEVYDVSLNISINADKFNITVVNTSTGASQTFVNLAFENAVNQFTELLVYTGHAKNDGPQYYDNICLADSDADCVVVGSTANSINLSYPVNGTHYNFGVGTYGWHGWINFSTSVNVSFYLNDSRFARNYSSNVSHQYRFYYENYTALGDGTYYFEATAVNTTNDNTTLVFQFGIDTNYPVISANNLNGSIGDRNGSNIGFQLNFSDDFDLWSINLSTLDLSFYRENINNSAYQYNDSIPLTNHTPGVYYLNGTVCDGHTARVINDWDVSVKVGNKILFTFGNDWLSVEPKDSGSFLTANFIKKSDRYTLDFAHKAGVSGINTYLVKSSNPIHVIKNNLFTGWLVIPSLRKWVDFENSMGYAASVKQVDDFTVEISSLATSFNSVGSLNCNNFSIPYYVIQQRVAYNENVLEGSYQPYSLYVNITDLPLLNRSVTLTYNNSVLGGTLYAITNPALCSLTLGTCDQIRLVKYQNVEMLSGVHNVSHQFFFNYSLNLDYSFNTSKYNQTVFNAGVHNCTVDNYDWLIYNISTYHETNLNLLNVSLLGTFYYWSPSNVSDRENVTINLVNQNNFLICADANVSIDVDAYLQNIDAFTHRFYIYNDSVSPASPILLKLYNMNVTTGFSDLLGTTRHAINYLYYENIVASLLRFYPGENLWRTVQIDLSDDFGTVFFDVIEQNTDYKIIFKTTSNEVLKETNAMKLICDSSVCTLTFLLPETGTISSSDYLDVYFIYDNVTQILNVTWSDLEGDSRDVLINVTIPATRTAIYDAAQIGSRGYWLVNLSSIQNNMVKVVVLAVDPVQNYYVPQGIAWIATLGSSFRDFNDLGLTEAFIFGIAIMLVCIFAGVISPVMTLITGIVGAYILLLLQIFNFAGFIIIVILAGALAYKLKY